MIIAFETESLREVYNIPARAINLYGPDIARTLAIRFADLEALANAANLIEYFGAYVYCRDNHLVLALPIEDKYLILLAANHPTKPNSNLDWNSVKRVKIIAIESVNELPQV